MYIIEKWLRNKYVIVLKQGSESIDVVEDLVLADCILTLGDKTDFELQTYHSPELKDFKIEVYCKDGIEYYLSSLSYKIKYVEEI